ncbi:hypothetical protein U9M48_038194 [Paspalum notatum var. saurae]|uniref:Uncharacterized protein n=1 Tax=Paspalum notatum var. saurae TaxID=547442 RepID=A0AAQ3UKU4_PASNO
MPPNLFRANKIKTAEKTDSEEKKKLNKILTPPSPIPVLTCRQWRLVPHSPSPRTRAPFSSPNHSSSPSALLHLPPSAPTMSSASHPPPVIGKSGNLTVFIPPPVEPESPGSEFSTPPTSPRSEDSPDSPPDTPKAPEPADPPSPPVGLLISFSTPPLVRTVSPLLPAERLSRTHPVQESSPPVKSASASLQAAPELPSRPLPPVQVPPPPVRTVSSPLSAEKLSRTHPVQESPPLVKSVSAPLQAPEQPSRPPPALQVPPQLVRTVSPPLPAEKLSRTQPVQESPPLVKSVSAPRHAPELPSRPPPAVQVPPQLVRTVSPPLSAEKLSRTQSFQESPPLVISVSAPLQAPELASRPSPPPVQVPPPQFEKASPGLDGSALAFFWDAVARVQKAHASLDEHISRWFGLDQSKYQWALNDYYERTGQVIPHFREGFWQSWQSQGTELRISESINKRILVGFLCVTS